MAGNPQRPIPVALSDNARAKSTTDCTALLVPEPALRVLQILEQEGEQAWLVGGFVRDSIMGTDPQDADIATSALPEHVMHACEAHGLKVYPTGIAHGTITVIDSAYPAFPIEVTTFRSDGAYSDARRPDSVEFVSSIDEDLARRDFTMNAIAYNPSVGFRDPFNGIAAIEGRLIECVGDPSLRFSEDALRILRGCRFASQLGFEIDEDCMRAMMSCKHLLSRISIERIHHELDLFLLGSHVHDALLACVDVLGFVVPELVAMKGCVQKTPYHIYDVLEHTAYVVQNTPPSSLVRWAALCHDMGKPAAAFFDDEGVEHFYGHARVSTVIARGLLRRLKMSEARIDDILVLVQKHDALKIEPTTKSIRRALMKLGGREDLFEALLDLKQADASAQSDRALPRLEKIKHARATYTQVLADKMAFRVKDLAIDGHDLIEIGYNEGPELGETLALLLEEVVNETLANERAELLARAGALLTKRDGVGLTSA